MVQEVDAKGQLKVLVGKIAVKIDAADVGTSRMRMRLRSYERRARLYERLGGRSIFFLALLVGFPP